MVVYDNKMGSDDTGYDTQELGGGSITIHGNNGNGGGNGNNNARVQDWKPKPASRIPSEFKVFPNPSSGRLNILPNEDWMGQEAMILVRDMSGKLIHQVRTITNTTTILDIEYEGVYFITISNGMNSVTKKCVVIK